MNEHSIHNVQPLRSKNEIAKAKHYFNQGKMGSRNLLIFTIGLNTGLMCRDIVSLKVKHVKYNKEIYIYEIGSCKQRKIDLTNISKEIDDYIKSQNFQSDEDYLFPSRTYKVSNHISVGGFYKIVRRVEKQMGRNDLGTYTMRKTFGYFYYKETKNIDALRVMFHHNSNNYTKNYIGINDEQESNLKNFKL